MITRMDLHGGWTFGEAGSRRTLPAEVPGCVHLDLLRNGSIPDPFFGSNELGLQWIEERDWSYTTRFGASADLLANEEIELVAEGLDTLATVRLNGKEIARSDNMFVPLRLGVRDRLKQGSNALAVEFASPAKHVRQRIRGDADWVQEWNDPVGGASRIRKEQCAFGWDWGPRFATSGIWRPIRLEAWSGNRLRDVRVRQEHRRGRVRVRVDATTARRRKSDRVRIRLRFGGRLVGESVNGVIDVRQPRLWWPNGLGAADLYDLETELIDAAGAVLDRDVRRIGLRTLVLERKKDRWGESFQFVVNGRPVFARGANWIPAHAFAPAATPELIDNLLTSAAEAHMNMIRVWGGGFYEREAFYDRCDALGLMVWQDFMFACALYPADETFLASVRAEAESQVRRLRHRACLALWCGNNEIEQMSGNILKRPTRREAYEALFYGVLPRVVETEDGTTPYWPSSPHNPEGWEKGHNNERAGDCHFWDVWFGRAPVKHYETKGFRFCSEFGMQSYSSPEVAETFCRPDEMNVFGTAMENHQKSRAGNAIILDYVSRLYRFPKDYAGLAYLSQLNQAYCMRVGIEHFRRSMPRTMGALYWQLNDCWPVFSWSGIEFGGRWKALHYEARRFNAPLLVSAHQPGDEWAGIHNRIHNTLHTVELYTVCEDPKLRAGRLRWELHRVGGGVVDSGGRTVTLRYGRSVRQCRLDFADAIAKHGAANLVLSFWVESSGRRISEGTALFTAPRFVNLPRKPISVTVRAAAEAGAFELRFRSTTYQHRAAFHLRGTEYRASDNFFDLLPGIERRIVVRPAGQLRVSDIRERLEITSLAHACA